MWRVSHCDARKHRAVPCTPTGDSLHCPSVDFNTPHPRHPRNPLSKNSVVPKFFRNFVPNFREQDGEQQNPQLKTKQKGMKPMNTLIKFSDALCHPVSARRPAWPRGGFANTTREQLAEIGRAFARGDKRTVDQACEELKGSLMSQRIFNSNTCRILFATCLSTQQSGSDDQCHQHQ